MNKEKEGQAGDLSLAALAVRCVHEIKSYRRGETQESPALLDLLRRGMARYDKAVREALRQCFEEFVRDWMRRHPRKEVICRLVSEEYCVELTFERFWQVVMQRQGLDFSMLPVILACLQASFTSVMIDALRAYAQSTHVAFVETDQGGEWGEVHDQDGGIAWEAILNMLPNERERRVAYLLFSCGMQPGEIVRHNPLEFGDVEEVARIRRKLVARFVGSGFVE